VKGKLTGARDQGRKLHRAMADADATRRAALLGGQFARNSVRRKTAKATGTVTLAGLVTKAMPLRAEYKGERYRATLRLDGYISYAGNRYASPAAATRAVIGRAGNGWSFWHYRTAKSGWVPLGEFKR
jgi:hypothetical protein